MRLLAAVTALALLGGCESVERMAREVGEAATAPTAAETADALRQALVQGVRRAVDELGRPGGFLDDPALRIPPPGALADAAALLRRLGQDRLVDELETSLNRAAERAVGEAFPVFARAAADLTVTDALEILNGPEDAATRYFQRRSEPELRLRFRPIVAEATDRSGVAAAYKRMLAVVPAGLAGGLGAADLDAYVADRAVEALFGHIAREEAAIRADPARRTTELMRRVFGAAG